MSTFTFVVMRTLTFQGGEVVRHPIGAYDNAKSAEEKVSSTNRELAVVGAGVIAHQSPGGLIASGPVTGFLMAIGIQSIAHEIMRFEVFGTNLVVPTAGPLVDSQGKKLG